MAAKKYHAKATVMAAPWHGNPDDLNGFPDLNYLDHYVGADGNLHFTGPQGWTMARCHLDYVVRGITGFYFPVPAEVFGREYTEA